MRDEIVSVAIRLFGEHGFDGTSTRMLASQAGTTMSNITYHFGGKDGLYAAAGQAILDRLAAVLAEKPVAPLAKGASRDDAFALIDQVIENMGTFMLREDVAPMARFVAREHEDPSSEVGKQLGVQVRRIGGKLTDAIALLRPDLSPEQCRARAFFIYAMLTGLRNARAPLCAILQVEAIDQRQGENALTELRQAVREMLEQP